MSLKRILLIGDSIRMGYTPFVKEMLKNKAEILVIKENCQDSKKVRKKVKKWLTQFGKHPIDIVQFNCGLHDIKRKFKSQKYQVPIEKYKENLRMIIDLLQKNTKARLIWATITPVIFERHHKNKSFDRYENDVDDYNAAATKIMQDNGIQINDLFSIIEKNNPKECILMDGVHMTEQGYSFLAQQVLLVLEKYL